VRAGPTAALVAALIAVLCAGLWLGGHPARLPEPLRDLFVDDTVALSGEAADLIQNHYYRSVPGSELENGSVRGMVDALRREHRADRFSRYFDPHEAQILDEETEGRFSGVGLTVDEVKKGLKVVDVFPKSPAQRAGIQAGDVIISVDGKSIAGQPSEVSTAKIKGPEGTKVTLGVARPSSNQVRKLILERQQIATQQVSSKLLRRGGQKLGYVDFRAPSSFSQGVNAQLRRQTKRVEDRGAEGILLDLRGNPGGLLTEAVLTAGVYLPKGSKVVSTDSRTDGRHVFRAPGGPLPRREMVVLIDRGTASAAEILASALADHGLAEVVGTRSFGKGFFQDVLGLSNGGELDISAGRFFTADGVSLAPNGIHPDVEARDDPSTGVDEAKQRALGVLAHEVSTASPAEPAG
jgi:carboxyl-terminal processing protease